MLGARVAPPRPRLQPLQALPMTQLGSSELRVSRVGLGTMTFGERNSYNEAAYLLSMAGTWFGQQSFVLSQS
jgi:hypothetical protein